MAKIEELEAALDGIWLDVGDGVIDMVEALNAIESAHEVYKDELSKQAKTPREPVSDEGNPLV